MVTSNKSQRVKSKQALTHASDRLRAASHSLSDVYRVYHVPYPIIGEACKKCIEAIAMIETLVWDLRSQL